jgi:hypothetical protein
MTVNGTTQIIISLCFLAAISMTVPVSAQTVKVQGYVVDMTGAPVPNARVLLIDLTTLEIQRVSSDSKGAFEFNGLTRTPYEIKAASQGFVTGSTKIFGFGDKVLVSPNPPPPLTVEVKITLIVGSTT